jgi:hypothetical protein
MEDDRTWPRNRATQRSNGTADSDLTSLQNTVQELEALRKRMPGIRAPTSSVKIRQGYLTVAEDDGRALLATQARH